jgi:hypothetical protein
MYAGKILLITNELLVFTLFNEYSLHRAWVLLIYLESEELVMGRR